MKAKTIFYCSECGNETLRWQGQCPSCRAWNTLIEAPQKENKPVVSGAVQRAVPKKISDLDIDSEIRFSCGIGELDRVLGGGAVRGSIVLFGGAPGIGKSTLLLQVCGQISATETILYVTGEESERQLKMRAGRLLMDKNELFVLAGNELSDVIAAIEQIKPTLVIIDSIQTIFDSGLASTPGSVAQVKQCAMAIMQLAKASEFTAFIVGHVNKEGAIAGPKVLEHMVDCVLRFEGDGNYSYRILRAEKNRFGSTNEIGVFDMQQNGLVEVPNPSEMLLSGRPSNVPGTCVTCVMEGSRPVLAEIQALITPTTFSAGRRNSNGFDYNRTLLLMAVIEKQLGLNLSSADEYINVIGGLTIDEPAADLAAALAIVSSCRNAVIPDDMSALGEIGLTGELRSVEALSQRLAEIERLGFSSCVIPYNHRGELKAPQKLQLIRAKNIRDAVKKILG